MESLRHKSKQPTDLVRSEGQQDSHTTQDGSAIAKKEKQYEDRDKCVKAERRYASDQASGHGEQTGDGFFDLTQDCALQVWD
jgi:hypothetical protein